MTYAGCLVAVDEPRDAFANGSGATDPPRLPQKSALGLRRRPSSTRFFDGREHHTAFRRAVQDVVAVVAVRAIRGMCEIAHRTEVLSEEMVQYRVEEDQRIADLDSLHDAYKARVITANRARDVVALIEPAYFDAILWLIILSRTPA